MVREAEKQHGQLKPMRQAQALPWHKFTLGTQQPNSKAEAIQTAQDAATLRGGTPGQLSSALSHDQVPVCLCVRVGLALVRRTGYSQRKHSGLVPLADFRTRASTRIASLGHIACIVVSQSQLLRLQEGEALRKPHKAAGSRRASWPLLQEAVVVYDTSDQLRFSETMNMSGRACVP